MHQLMGGCPTIALPTSVISSTIAGTKVITIPVGGSIVRNVCSNATVDARIHEDHIYAVLAIVVKPHELADCRIERIVPGCRHDDIQHVNAAILIKHTAALT